MPRARFDCFAVDLLSLTGGTVVAAVDVLAGGMEPAGGMYILLV